MPDYKQYLRFDPLTLNWLVILSGTAGRVGLNFLAGVLMVRALGPADFGLYSLLTAAAGLAGVWVDFGLTEAAVKQMAAAQQADKPTVSFEAQARLFFWLRLGLAVGGVGLGLLVAGPLSRWGFGLVDGGLLLSLALLGVITTALSGSVNAMLQAGEQFTAISKVLILSSAASLAVVVGLTLMGQLTLMAVLLGVGSGTSLVGFLIGYQMLPPSVSLSQPPSYDLFRQAGPRLVRFGGWLWIANIFKVSLAYLDMFLLNLWLSPAAVGVYALALGLSSRLEMVNHSLYTVLLPMASALANRQAVKHYLWQGLVRGGLVSLGLLMLWPLSTWGIPLIYGQAYREAVWPFQLLLGVVIFDILTLPTMLLIYTADRPDISTFAEGVRVAVLLSLAVWLIPLIGLEGAIAAKFIAKLLGVLVTVILLMRGTLRS